MSSQQSMALLASIRERMEADRAAASASVTSAQALAVACHTCPYDA